MGGEKEAARVGVVKGAAETGVNPVANWEATSAAALEALVTV